TLPVSASETECFRGSWDAVNAFVTGHGQAPAISGVYDCASRALGIFAERTRGAEAGRYSPQELRSFLETYFIRGFRISDRLLAQLMQIKRAVIGGSAERLTTAE